MAWSVMRGEGGLDGVGLADGPPHPDCTGRSGACHRARVRATRWHRRGNPTSPRKRGEVPSVRTDSTQGNHALRPGLVRVLQNVNSLDGLYQSVGLKQG